MKRISSSLTSVYKVGSFLITLIFLEAAYTFSHLNIFPTLMALAAAIANAITWWRYVLPSRRVFISDNGLSLDTTNSEANIPFESVLIVHQPRFIRGQLLVVTFLNKDGLKDRFTFIPSFRESGGYFQNNMEWLLKGRIEHGGLDALSSPEKPIKTRLL